MATTIQLLRSDIARQRPDPGVLANGVPVVNLHESEPGLFFSDRTGTLFKVGPVAIGTDAPNTNPEGKPGNSKGETWLDTSGTDPILKVYDGGSWVKCFEDPGGTVTSVGLTFSSLFTVSNSPVTTSGTLIASLQEQVKNTIFAGPDAVDGTPSFRSLVAADIPLSLGGTTFSSVTVTGTSDLQGDITIGSDSADTLTVNALVGSSVLVDTASTYDLGDSTNTWANVYADNVYAGDVHMSNEGGSNEIDGTWGKYTIQEGEEDLYLINRRSGKKYKFVLQEIQ